MIDVRPCLGCGRPLIHHSVANLAVRLEPTPLDGSEAVAEIIAGRSLWMVDAQRVRPARPGEPGPLREHRCTETAQAALSRPFVPTPGPSVQPTPQRLSAGRTAPSSGPSGGNSSVRSAERAHTDHRSHPCDACREPVVLDGPELYVSVELGATVMWAVHETCRKGVMG